MQARQGFPHYIGRDSVHTPHSKRGLNGQAGNARRPEQSMGGEDHQVRRNARSRGWVEAGDGQNGFQAVWSPDRAIFGKIRKSRNSAERSRIASQTLASGIKTRSMAVVSARAESDSLYHNPALTANKIFY
jgi:hypothetical protein